MFVYLVESKRGVLEDALETKSEKKLKLKRNSTEKRRVHKSDRGVRLGDVLQFPRVQKQDSEATATEVQTAPGAEATVVDVTQKILDQQSEDRRKVQRVVLNEFISAHVHVQGRGLLRVILRDIHDGGLAFDLNEREGTFNRGELLEMRFYMNHETYFKFNAKVAHFHHNADDGFYRHGCQFVDEGINDVALRHFILFLQNIAASLKTDRGDRTISQIYS